MKKRSLQFKEMQQKTADTLGHGQGSVISMAALLKETGQEVAAVLKETVEYRSKWQGVVNLDKMRLSLIKQIVPELRKLLSRARAAIMRLNVQHPSQLGI